jgi:hypothetical protein
LARLAAAPSPAAKRDEEMQVLRRRLREDKFLAQPPTDEYGVKAIRAMMDDVKAMQHLMSVGRRNVQINSHM